MWGAYKMKTCIVCKTDQPDSHFGSYILDHNRCRQCHAAIMTIFYKDKEKAKKARYDARMERPKAKPRAVHKYNKACRDNIDAIHEQQRLDKEFEL